MTSTDRLLSSTLPRDLTASLAVFVVAILLRLRITLASDAHMLSGVLSGIVGGIILGIVGHPQLNVSDPPASLAAIEAPESGGF